MLSLCLEMLFTDRLFDARIRAAGEAGYPAFEFWDWRDKDLKKVRQAADDCGLRVTAFSGNRLHAMANPADRAGFREEIKQSLEAAVQVGASTLMLLSDILLEDGSAAPLPPGLSATQKLESITACLADASELARGTGVVMALEPLNTRLDHPGYFLDNSADGFQVVRRVGSPQARLLYDAYHMAMMGEDIEAVVDANLDLIGHVHIADVPGRHEPGSGEINYHGLAGLLRRRNYAGAIGMEFSASGDSAAAAEAARRIFQA
jgi:hydroxypyruvate isomerase